MFFKEISINNVFFNVVIIKNRMGFVVNIIEIDNLKNPIFYTTTKNLSENEAIEIFNLIYDNIIPQNLGFMQVINYR